MHELSLCKALCDQILDLKKKDGIQKIYSITVCVGVLSGVEKHALEFSWPLVCNEILGEVKLNVEEDSLKIYCQDCHKESLKTDFSFLCDFCQGLNTEIQGGKDFVLKSMEVESCV